MSDRWLAGFERPRASGRVAARWTRLAGLALVLLGGCRVGLEDDERPPTEAALERAAGDRLVSALGLAGAERIAAPARAPNRGSGVSRVCGPSAAEPGERVRIRLTFDDPSLTTAPLIVRPPASTLALRVRLPVVAGQAVLELDLPGEDALPAGVHTLTLALEASGDVGLGNRWRVQVSPGSTKVSPAGCTYGPVPQAVAAVAMPAARAVSGQLNTEPDPRLAVASSTGAVWLFNTDTGARTLVVAGDGARPSVLVLTHADDNLLLVGDMAGALRTYDATTGAPQRSETLHLAPVSAVGVFAGVDGVTRLFSAGRDGVLYVVAIAGAAPTSAYWRLVLSDRINDAAVSADGRFIALATGRLAHPGALFVFEVATRRKILETHFEDHATAVTFADDSRRVFVASGRGRVNGLQLPDGAPIPAQFEADHHDLVVGLVFVAETPAGPSALVAGSLDGQYTVWDADDGTLLGVIQRNESPTALELGAHGRSVAIGDELGLTDLVSTQPSAEATPAMPSP